MKIGICNVCGRKTENDDPRMGAFCGEQKESRMRDEKTGKETVNRWKCQGVIIRHEEDSLPFLPD